MKQLHTPTIFEKVKASVLLTLTVTWTFFPSVSILADQYGSLIVDGVVNGDVSFQQNGSTTQITAPNQSIIEYHQFDIGLNETVQFIQPYDTATVLNRITASNNPSEILGSLIANGHVYLVNPAGIYFGKDSVVNVGALLAVAGNMTNKDYLNGLNRFSGILGEVVNRGTIIARDIAFLSGSSVSNHGTVESNLVTMVSGESVYLGELNGHFFIDVTSFTNSGESGVYNSGAISGDTVLLASGDALGLAIVHEGLIQAKDVAFEAASGTVRITGETELTADNGTMTATGTVVEFDGAVIDSGEHTGGFLGVYADEVSIDAQINLSDGSVLIDPDDVIIDTDAGTDVITVATIVAAINMGADFIVEALDSITVAAAIDTTGGVSSDRTLTFREEASGSDDLLVINLNEAIIMDVGETLQGGDVDNVGGTTVNVANNGLVSNAGDLVQAGGEIDVVGLAGTNSINVSDLGTAGSVTGEVADTLVGTAGDDTISLNAANTGTLGAVSFAGFGNVDAAGGTGDSVSTNALTELTGTDFEAITHGVTISNFEALSSTDGNLNGTDGADESFDLTGDNAGTVNVIAFSGITAIDAGTSTGDSITGTNDSDTFELDGDESGTVRGITFSEIETIIASNGGDFYTILAGMAKALTLGNGGDTVTINDGITLTGNVTGGAGDDTLIIGTGSSLVGAFDGGGNAVMGGDTLSYAGNTAAVSVNIDGSITTTGLTGGFSNVETVIGNDSTGTTTLVGTTNDDTFNLTAGLNAGNVDGGIAFQEITTIDASGGIGDSVNTNADTTLTGVANPNEAITNNITVQNFETLSATNGTLTGSDLSDTFDLSATNSGTANGIAFSDVVTINGSAGSDTYTVSGDTTRDLSLGSGGDEVTINNGVTLDGTVTGGTGDDTLVVGTGASVAGLFDGGGDNLAGDTLSYAGNTAAVSVNIDGSITTTGLTGGFSNVETVIGNSSTGITTLVGTAGSDVFVLDTDANSGNITGTISSQINFQDVTTINAGGDVDTFTVDIETAINLSGEAGNDIFNLNADPTGTLDGGADSNAFNVNVDMARDFTLGADGDAVTISNNVTLDGSITGGAGDDTLFIGDGSALSGTFDDSSTTDDDTLNYSNRTGTVTVSHDNSSATGINGDAASGFLNIESFVGNGSTDTTLTGTTGDDSFIIGSSDGSSIGISDLTVAGGGATTGDTLIGTTADDTFTLTGSEAGSVSNANGVDVAFNGIGIIDAGDHITGDIVETNAVTNLTGVNNQAMTNDVTVSDFEILSSSQALNGTDDDDNFSIGTLVNTVYGIVFTGITQINAGLNTTGDTVTTEFATTLTGIANEAETNGITISEFEFLDSQEGTLTGSALSDTFDLADDGTDTVKGIVFSGVTTINGSDGGDFYNVNETQARDLSLGIGGDTVTIADSKILTGTIIGNTGADRLIIGTGAQLVGKYAGGAGADTLEVVDGSQYVELTGSDVTNGFNGEFTAGDAIVNADADDFTGVDTLEFTPGTGNTLEGIDQTSFWDVDAGQYSEGDPFSATDPLNPLPSPTSPVLNFSGFDVLQGNASGDWFDISADATAQLKGGAGDDVFYFEAGILTSSAQDTAAIDGEADLNALAGALSLSTTQKAGDTGNDPGFNRSERILIPNTVDATDDPTVNEFLNVGPFKFNGATITDGDLMGSYLGDTYHVDILDDGIEIYDFRQIGTDIIGNPIFDFVLQDEFATNTLDTLELTNLITIVDVTGDFGSTLSFNAGSTEDSLFFDQDSVLAGNINLSSSFFYFGNGGSDTATFNESVNISGSGSFGLEAEDIDMNSNTLTTDSGSIAITTNFFNQTGAISSTSGDIGIDTGTSTFNQDSAISSNSGSINIGTGIFLQGSDISSTSGDITINTTRFDQSADISTGGSVIADSTSSYIAMFNGATTSGSTISYTAAADSVYLGTLNSTGAVTVTANGGSIFDFSSGDVNANVIGTDLTLFATNGIGNPFSFNGDNIDIAVDTLTVTNTSGTVDIQELDGLIINGVETTSGNIDIVVDAGNMVVDGTVVANTSGTVELTASNGSVDINANVSSASGTVSVNGDSITQDFDINTSGGLTLTADNGSIVMDTGTTATATSVNYNASGSITLEQLTAMSGNIDVTAGAGTLTVDDAVTASGNITLEAQNGAFVLSDNGDVNSNYIGSTSGTIGITGDSVAQNDDISTTGTVTVTADNGSIIMADTTETTANSISYDASGSITLEQLTATGGNIDVTAGAGTLTIDDLITASGSGDITLIAENGAVDLNNNSSAGSYISSTDGDVSITGDSVAQNDDISTTGTVTVTANSGSITMADTTETTGSAISYTATDDVLLSVLNSSGTVGVTADSNLNATGAISDNLTSEDANVTGTDVTLSAATGIGVDSDADIDTSVDTLTATNSTSGAIVIDETNAVGLVAVTNTGRAVKLTAGGAITDSNSTENTDIDIEGSTVELTAGGAIGASSSLLDVSVTTMLDANTGSSNSGIYIDGGSTGLPLGAINAGSGTVILSSGTNITDATIDESTANLVAGNATLLATLGIGGADDADVDTEVTSLSLTNSSSGDIVVSDTDETDAAGFSATNSGGNIDFIDAGDIALGLVDAGANSVTLDSGGSITDGNGSATNVTADSVVLTAVGNIGSGNDTESDINDAAINITVTSVEAQAGTDIYLESSQAITIGGASDTLTGLTGGTDDSGDGVVKLKSAGTITVDEAVVADTDILLLTTTGDINQNVNGSLTATTGNATVIAADNVSQGANIIAGNDAYVEATSGSVTMNAGTETTASDDIRYAAGTSAALGLLNATDSVSVVAGDNITDANSDEATNISGARARLVAGGSIGAAGVTASSDTNVNAVDISVANVEAQAINDIYLQSDQAVTVGGVDDVITDYERFASGDTPVTDSNLTGLSSSSFDVKLKSAGTITVNEVVDAGEDVLLLTTSGGDIDQEAGINSGRLLSIIAAGNVNQNANLSVIDLGGLRDVYVEAQDGDIVMESGTQTDAGYIRYVASDTGSDDGAGNIALGLLSGSLIIRVVADGNITDANLDEDPNISGTANVGLEAGGSIGSNMSTGAVNISVPNVEALAGTNVYLKSDQEVIIGGSSSGGIVRAYFASGFEGVSGTDLTGIQGTNGEVQFESTGSITISEVVDAGADLTLETTSGDITQNVAIATTADINLIAAGNVNQNEDVSTTGGTVTVTADTGAITMQDGRTTQGLLGIVYRAATNVALSVLDSGSSVEVTADNDSNGTGSITDNLGTEAANIIGTTAILSAATGIGDGDDINTAVTALSLTNSTSGNIVVSDTDTTVAAEFSADNNGGGSIVFTDSGDIALGLVDADTGDVTLDSGGTITDGNGSDGNVVANAATLNAANGIGSSDALETTITTLTATNSTSNDINIRDSNDLTIAGVQTQLGDGNINVDVDAGNLVVSGAVTADGNGGVTLNADNGSILMANGTTVSGASIDYTASDSVELGHLDAGSGDVAVTAQSGSITEVTAGTNITAGILRLEAGTDIGGVVGALDTSVNTLASLSGGGTYILETDVLIIDDTGSGILGNSALTRGGEAGGVYKVQTTSGSITVAAASESEAIQAGSAILLRADGSGSDLIQQDNANVVSTGSSNISLLAQNTITQNANVTTAGGTVDVEASNSSITMADGSVTSSNDGVISYIASGNIVLGLLDAGVGSVVISTAGGDIVEATSGTGTNIAADYVRLESGNGSIGQSGDGNALDLDVAAVGSTSGADTYLLEADAITVDDSGINAFSVSRVELGLSASAFVFGGLPFSGEAGGVYKVQTTSGSITVADAIQAGSDILLQAGGVEADGIDSNLNLQNNGNITSTGAGYISLLAEDTINQDANVTTNGGTVDVEAFGNSIAMADGTVTNSNGGNIRYAASGNIELGLLNAGTGDVSVTTDGGNIVEATSGTDINIIANYVRLEASGSIGDGNDEDINDTSTSPSVAGSTDVPANPGVPDFVTPSVNALDVDVTALSSSSGDDTFIYNLGDLTVDNTGSDGVTVQRVDLASGLTATTDAALTQSGFAGGDYTIAAGGSLNLNGNDDGNVDNAIIESGGDQTYIYSLNDSTNTSESRLNFENNYTLDAGVDAGGDIIMTANRSELLEALPIIIEGVDTGLLGSPTTIISDGFDVTIEADGNFTMGQFEKMSIGSDPLRDADATSGNGDLTITAANAFVGDINVQGDLSIDLGSGTLNIVERQPQAGFEDQAGVEERGADIAVAGTLNFTGGTIQGTAGGAIQEVIPIGGGEIGTVTPFAAGNNVLFGPLDPAELFLYGPEFDNISNPVAALQFFPYVVNNEVFELEPTEEKVPEALRDELLKLRIFARELSEEEDEERRKKGYVYTPQIIVDELAPISAYEVALTRISAEIAQDAVDFAKELIGEEGAHLEAISAGIGSAFEEFVESNPDGTAEDFAQYLSISTAPNAVEAFEYVNRFNQLFEKIENMGLTETELSISRRNILSRLKVDGLRGREMIEFFDSFVLANETELSLFN